MIRLNLVNVKWMRSQLLLHDQLLENAVYHTKDKA